MEIVNWLEKWERKNKRQLELLFAAFRVAFQFVGLFFRAPKLVKIVGPGEREREDLEKFRAQFPCV